MTWCARCATDQNGLACFAFMIDCRVAYWSNPRIASGRYTRGRLAACWPDGFVLVPQTLSDRDYSSQIGPNLPRFEPALDSYERII